MSVTTLRDMLFWCSVIDYGLLIVWAALYWIPHEWVYRVYGRWFRVSREQFDAINLAGLVLFKCGVLLFNVVPYIALRLVA